MKALESFIGSAGILVVGLITIPLAGELSGVHIGGYEAMKMSLLFFTGRFFWLWLLRVIFEKHGK